MMNWRNMPGPGDLYERAIAREERAEMRRIVNCHDAGDDCGVDECEVCEERRSSNEDEDEETEE